MSIRGGLEEVSGTPGWNAFKEFSNYLLLLQPTVSALHFVIDFSLSKLTYEAPEENELHDTVLNYTYVLGERLWKDTWLGQELGPWEGLEARVGDRTCRCGVSSCRSGINSLC